MEPLRRPWALENAGSVCDCDERLHAIMVGSPDSAQGLSKDCQPCRPPGNCCQTRAGPGRVDAAGHRSMAPSPTPLRATAHSTA